MTQDWFETHPIIKEMRQAGFTTEQIRDNLDESVLTVADAERVRQRFNERYSGLANAHEVPHTPDKDDDTR
jgi:DNA-binding transcriptional MerR regulator